MNATPRVSPPDRLVTLSRRIPELDGIRGIAILLVLLWHYAACRLKPEPGSGLAILASFLGLTWSGVDLFFVLSGFLIGGLLLDNQESKNYFKTFYIRRACRIIPLYYLVVFGFFAAAAFGLAGRSEEFRWLFGGPMPFWSYPTFTQNFLMARESTFGANGLGVTWSLAVEEQFYLLFPLVIYCVPKRALPYVLLLGIAAAPAFRIWLSPSQDSATAPGYVLMPARADALLLGALAAWAIRSATAWRNLVENRGTVLLYFGILLVGVIALSFFMSDFAAPHMNWWGRSALALFYVLFLLLPLLKQNGFMAAVLRFGPLRQLGAISYGVYLLHQPVIGLTYALALSGQSNVAFTAQLLTTLLALVLTIALATALYHAVEKPILRFGHTYKY